MFKKHCKMALKDFLPSGLRLGFVRFMLEARKNSRPPSNPGLKRVPLFCLKGLKREPKP